MPFMPREQCNPYQEDLAAYSLGALDADERRALEAHLSGCEDCRAELAGYREIAEGLLHALPPRGVPSSLRQRLTDRIRPAQNRTSSLIPRARFRLSPGQILNAIVLVVLIVSNAFSALEMRRLRDQQAALTTRLSSGQAAIAMLSYPNTKVHLISPDVQNLSGSALVDGDLTTAVLILWNLPALDPSLTYQIWLINASGDRISAGLFVPTIGQEYTTALIQSVIPLKEFSLIGVTVEPAGGSEQPTGSRLLVVEL